MNRARVGVGIVAVAAGTAWALGGLDSLVTFARMLAGLLPLILVIGGAAAILFVAVPRGTLAGPILLIAIGALGLAVELGGLRKSPLVQIPAFILIGLGVVIAMSPQEKHQIDIGVQRNTAILFPVHRRPSGKAPVKLIMRAIFGLLLMDLSQADYPGTARLGIDVTCVMGRVELTLPKNWEVQAGRIELARRMTFEGKLTSAEVAPLTEQIDEVGKNLVVLNVQGWAGTVRVQQV